MKITACLTWLLLALPIHVFAQPTIAASAHSGALGGAPSTTVAVDLPSGTTTGDLVVACVSGGVSATDTSDMSASGWTHVLTVGGATTAAPKLSFLWRYWQSGDANPFTVTIGTQTNSNRRWTTWRLTGAHATPSAGTAVTDGATSTTARSYASITTTAANTLLLGCLQWSSNDSTYTPDGSLTNAYLVTRSASDTDTQAASGASGGYTGSGASASWRSLMWAVAPSTAAPATSVNCMLLGVCGW